MSRETTLGRCLNQCVLVALVCLLVVGCGGRSVAGGSGEHARRSSSVVRASSATTAAALAAHVCQRAADAASARLRGAVAMRVTDADPAYLECILDGRGFHVDVIGQAIAQALGDYDTTLIHLVQTYIYPGPPDGKGDRGQLPHPIAGIGVKAAWIPGPSQLLATNGTAMRGGNFLSVTVTGSRTSGPARFALARAVAAATLPAEPRGPNLRSDH